MPKYREEVFKKNYAFSLYDIYDHSLVQEPPPGGNGIYNFCRPFFAHHYYILSLSILFFGIERILKEIMYFHCMTYSHALAQELPASEVMKFTIMVDPSLVIIPTYLV